MQQRHASLCDSRRVRARRAGRRAGWRSLAAACLAGAFAVAACRDAVAVPPLVGVQQISAGSFSTCAVVGGAAECWGVNLPARYLFGQTWYDYFASSATPVPQFDLHSGVTRIAVANYHVCAIVSGGAVCWGDNEYGSVGSPADSYYPAAVTGLDSGVTDVSAGGFTSCAVAGGAAKCWGNNYFGQLGNALVATGYGGYSQASVTVDGLTSGVSRIVVAPTYALGSQQGISGRVCAIVGQAAYCWGHNDYGDLGNNSVSFGSWTATPTLVTGLGSGVTDIATGLDHTCAVVNGGAWCWGANYAGQLGSNAVAVQGLPFGTSTPTAVTGLSSGVVAIAAGGDFTCALVGSDAVHPLKCWGGNRFGQLGNGSAISASTPVNVSFPTSGAVSGLSAGFAHACALLNVGGTLTADCWGDEEDGQLGVANSDYRKPMPVAVVDFGKQPLAGVTALGSGHYNNHACAIVGGAAQCWGDNSGGQLGDGTYVDRGVAYGVSGLTANVTSISEGDVFSCAIVSGVVECWGPPNSVNVGRSCIGACNTPTAVAVLGGGATQVAAAGVADPGNRAGHACALVSGAVWCWGWDDVGQLGVSPATLGHNYSIEPVAVASLSAGVSWIATGSMHTCAVVDGGAQCWGNNNIGQLGSAPGPASAVPASVTGLGAGAGVSAVAAGDLHTCAIVNGGAQCWGSNFLGQLGNGDSSGAASGTPVPVQGLASGVSAIAASASTTCAVVSGGVYCWGSDATDQLGPGLDKNCFYLCSSTPVMVFPAGSNAVEVSVGLGHACARFSGGNIKCWGNDSSGQLGDARTLSIELPQAVVTGDPIFTTEFE